MPRRIPVKPLSRLCFEELGQLVARHIAKVSEASFDPPKRHQSFNDLIQANVLGVQRYLFSPLPESLYDELAAVLLRTVTEVQRALRGIYRMKGYFVRETPRTLHTFQVWRGGDL